MEIKTPDLGVDSADVAEILVKVGDVVEKEQSLLVLESAKASVEVPSPASGTIKSIVIKAGQSVTQGDVLFELEDADNAEHEDSQAEAGQNSQAPDSEQAKTKSSQAEQAEKTSDTGTKESSLKEVKVPDLGVDEADISEILVNVGDVVEKDQSLLVLESAKASVEVPSPFAGVIREINLSAGQKVSQGMLILSVEMSAINATSDDRQQSSKSAGTQDKPQPQGQSTATPSISEKQTASKKPPTDQEQKEATDRPEREADQAHSAQLSPEEIKANSKVYAGPAVRQLARQLGVALANVEASGANQRIVKEDVLAFVKQHFDAQQSTQTNQNNTHVMRGLPKLPDFEKFGGAKSAAMTRLQQVSVPQLSLNNFIPQVTQFDLADITELEKWRGDLKADYKKQGISLTILAFIIKALAYLLKQEPYFNSHLADDQKSVLLRNEIHLGIAVATDDGLTVPVLRNPDRLSIQEIAIQLGELSQKARDKKLTPQELQGASFTITSLGSIGGTAFTPLVNWPQVAILGISPASMQAVWNGKEFAPRLMLPLSLSYDHRVINGADAARFSHALSQLLADIRRTLL